MANGPIPVPCAAWSTNVFQMLFLSLGNSKAKPSELKTLCLLWCTLLSTARGLKPWEHPPIIATAPQPQPSLALPWKQCQAHTCSLWPHFFLTNWPEHNNSRQQEDWSLVDARLRREPQLLILHQLLETTGLLGAQKSGLVPGWGGWVISSSCCATSGITMAAGSGAQPDWVGRSAGHLGGAEKQATWKALRTPSTSLLPTSSGCPFCCLTFPTGPLDRTRGRRTAESLSFCSHLGQVQA